MAEPEPRGGSGPAPSSTNTIQLSDELTADTIFGEEGKSEASAASCLTRSCCWGYCSLGTAVVCVVLAYFAWSAYIISGLVAPRISEIDEYSMPKEAMGPAWAAGERVRTILYACPGGPKYDGRGGIKRQLAAGSPL